MIICPITEQHVPDAWCTEMPGPEICPMCIGDMVVAAELLAEACRMFLDDHSEGETRPLNRLCHCPVCARAIEALEAYKAAQSYDVKARELFGEFAYTNFEG